MSCATIPEVPMETANTLDDDVDTESWLTYAQVTDLCGISNQTVRNYAKRGLLTPRRARRAQASGSVKEVWVYDPREVARLPKRKLNAVPSEGEMAARAFELFDDGLPLRRVVTEMRETPARVSELHEQWVELGGSELVIGKIAQAEITRFIGPFDGVAGLVQRLGELLGEKIDVVVSEDQTRLEHATDGQIEGALVKILDEVNGTPAS